MDKISYLQTLYSEKRTVYKFQFAAGEEGERNRFFYSQTECYEILKWIYDNCQDIGGVLIEETKATLLKGLSDDDPHLQDLMFE